MLKLLPITKKFVLVPALCFLVVSCACTEKSHHASASPSGRTLRKVRTTAYTHTEKGGRSNAIGQRLSGDRVISASADWSRYPLGTRFRILDTNQVFVIDDYGSALVGTNTIDLYKTNRSAMNQWGVRAVDIEILAWGSPEQSLAVLQPRARNRYIRSMISELGNKI